METKIKKGEYVLNIDDQCKWIAKIVKARNGRKTERRITGYYKDTGDVYRDFLRKAEARGHKSMKELLTAIEEAETRVYEFGNRR